MSNKLRLQTNNTNLQELINKANALPDAGGGSGGGSVETCNLTVRCGALATIIYNTVDDSGKITSSYMNAPVANGIVGVCGTAVTIIYNNMATGNFLHMLSNAELVTQTTYSITFKLTAGANETAAITMDPGT
jgi:hypothetical protein